MKIIRVFPRRTRATPDDELVRIGCAPTLFDEADEVHVSVTFTWDLPLAERLANAWKGVGAVKMGGPAVGGGEGPFTPGMYMKKGWVITSRGCDNTCWFCEAWRRNGKCKPLPITDGHIVQDDNLLGCPDFHIKDVFAMLSRQKERADLRGLEAKLLKPWHVGLFQQARIQQLWFAYDEPSDLEPLKRAGQMLTEAGFTYANRKARSYVLIGYKGDTIEQADKRLRDTVTAGFMPFAMLWKDKDGRSEKGWGSFQRQWARPAIISSMMKGQQ